VRHNSALRRHIKLMKHIFLLLAAIFAAQQLPAQQKNDIHGCASHGLTVSYASLALFTNGSGRIFPFQDGQMLRVGREYSMFAIPDRGFVFTNWNQVNVFTLTSVEIDYNTIPPTTNFVTSVDVSPLPAGPGLPFLRFTMEPEQTLYETASGSLTVSVGWQANFVPRDEFHPRHFN
jgi:hypothetical protein